MHSPSSTRGCLLLLAAVIASAQGPPSVSSSITPTPTSTPRTASPTPSVGSSASPSPSPAPLPFGTIKEIAVLDCNGGAHFFPGTPLELNLNLRGLRYLFNFVASEIQLRVECQARNGPGCPQLLDPAQAPELLERHFIPSPLMFLNWLAPIAQRRSLPPNCMVNGGTPLTPGSPMFAQSFFDDSSISRVFSRWFGLPRTPVTMLFPATCTYERYAAGLGCTMEFNEPISNQFAQLAMDRCPSSAMPYLSLSCRGDWCQRFFFPCSRAVAGDCGTTGLACRKAWLGNTDQPITLPNFNGQLMRWLIDYGFVNKPLEFATFGGVTVATDFTTSFRIAGAQLRNFLYATWNISRVETQSQFTEELTFCLPPEDTYQRINSLFWASAGTTVPTDLDVQTAQCTANGCNVGRVGDGRCDIACYNAACKWDGNDCGGPPVSFAQADPPSSAQPDRTLRAPCMITTAWLQAQPPPALDLTLNYNYWEECNGWSEFCQPNPAAGPNANGCVSCGGCPLRAGVLPTTPNPRCALCAPRNQCGGPGFPCAAASQQYVGLQQRFVAWDGAMRDGTNALDFDRKSGINLNTPGATWEPQGGTWQWNLRPLLQLTCSGELGLILGNANLQFGAHAPMLQPTLAFVASWLTDLQAARLRSMIANDGLPAATVLTPVQVEFRFMVHHMAHWAYQYLDLPGAGFLGPLVPLTPWGPGAPLAYNIPATQGGFGPNIVYNPTAPNGPAVVNFTDPLTNWWARREPGTAGTLSGSYGTPLNGWPWQTDWARAFRVAAPNNANDGCSFASTVAGLAGGGTGARICRATYNGFNTLFTRPDGSASDLAVHFDIRQDVCANAPTGAAPPLPSILPAAAARMALPSGTIAVQGALAQMLDSPRTCTQPTDCAYLPGTVAACVDVDTNLLGLDDQFNGRFVDPFGAFLFGGYNAGQTCGTFQDTRSSLRRFLRGLGGDTTPTLAADANNGPRFCFYTPTVLDGSQDWYQGAFAPGTCARRDYGAPNRNCLRYTPPGPQTAGGTLPNGNALAQQGIPASITGLVATTADNLFPRVAPGARAEGPSPFVPNVRSQLGGGGISRPTFSMSIPTMTLAQFTNSYKETLRWALASAFAYYGAGVSPDDILIQGVRNNGGAFTPLPAPRPGLPQVRAGITVDFAVEVPSDAVRINLTFQLRSLAPDTLGAQAGAVMARLGVVPFRAQREIMFQERFPPPPPFPEGLIVLIVIVLALVGAVGSYFLSKTVLRPRGIRIPLCPSHELVAYTCRRSAGLLLCGLLGRGSKPSALKSGGATKPTGVGDTVSASNIMLPGVADKLTKPAKTVVANPLIAAAAAAAGASAPPSASAPAAVGPQVPLPPPPGSLPPPPGSLPPPPSYYVPPLAFDGRPPPAPPPPLLLSTRSSSQLLPTAMGGGPAPYPASHALLRGGSTADLSPLTTMGGGGAPPSRSGYAPSQVHGSSSSGGGASGGLSAPGSPIEPSATVVSVLPLLGAGGSSRSSSRLTERGGGDGGDPGRGAVLSMDGGSSAGGMSPGGSGPGVGAAHRPLDAAAASSSASSTTASSSTEPEQ